MLYNIRDNGALRLSCIRFESKGGIEGVISAQAVISGYEV